MNNIYNCRVKALSVYILSSSVNKSKVLDKLYMKCTLTIPCRFPSLSRERYRFRMCVSAMWQELCVTRLAGARLDSDWGGWRRRRGDPERHAQGRAHGRPISLSWSSLSSLYLQLSNTLSFHSVLPFALFLPALGQSQAERTHCKRHAGNALIEINLSTVNSNFPKARLFDQQMQIN